MSPDIKAVVFDCFGVLTSDGWLPLKRKYFSDNPEHDKQATELSKQLNVGMISFDEFVSKVAKLAGVPKAEVFENIQSNVPDEELFEYIRSHLKSNYYIGLLSNAGANWMNELFTPEQVELFDVVCLSCETGLLKPEPQAYMELSRQLALVPPSVVFVDDQERYVTAAKDVGMEGIWYKNFDQFKREFEKLATTKE